MDNYNPEESLTVKELLELMNKGTLGNDYKECIQPLEKLNNFINQNKTKKLTNADFFSFLNIFHIFEEIYTSNRDIKLISNSNFDNTLYILLDKIIQDFKDNKDNKIKSILCYFQKEISPHVNWVPRANDSKNNSFIYSLYNKVTWMNLTKEAKESASKRNLFTYNQVLEILKDPNTQASGLQNALMYAKTMKYPFTSFDKDLIYRNIIMTGLKPSSNFKEIEEDISNAWEKYNTEHKLLKGNRKRINQGKGLNYRADFDFFLPPYSLHLIVIKKDLEKKVENLESKNNQLKLQLEEAQLKIQQLEEAKIQKEVIEDKHTNEELISKQIRKSRALFILNHNQKQNLQKLQPISITNQQQGQTFHANKPQDNKINQQLENSFLPDINSKQNSFKNNYGQLMNNNNQQNQKSIVNNQLKKKLQRYHQY